MKLIANLLITVCLITGALSAATAYMIPIDGNEESLVGMKLGADAGALSVQAPELITKEQMDALPERFEDLIDPNQIDLVFRDAQGSIIYSPNNLRAYHRTLKLRSYANGSVKEPEKEPEDTDKVETANNGTKVVTGREKLLPVVPKGAVLDGTAMEFIALAGVPHVRVSSFDFTLWPHNYIFIASCVGLLAGAGIIRFTGKTVVEEGGTGTFEAAQVAFGAIDLALAELAEELPKMPESEARLHLIMEQLGELQTGAIPAFVDCRPALVKVLGLSGYAELMDRFAALERQINRAWSAAADAHEEEAADCLAKTADLLTDTAEKLKRG